MTPAGGGFFAAQDADSGGEEGHVLRLEPAVARRGRRGRRPPRSSRRASASRRRATSRSGETVLSVVRIAPGARGGVRPDRRPRSRRILAEARAPDVRRRAVRRVPPGTDDKLLTDWTALAISAFALAGRVLAEPRYETAARAAADRILARCRARRAGSSTARRPGAPTSRASRPTTRSSSRRCSTSTRRRSSRGTSGRPSGSRPCSRRTSREPGGGYYLSAAPHDGLILRPRESFDGATPSSNSVAAMNLLRLRGVHRRRRATGDRADEVLLGLRRRVVAKASPAFPRLLCALDFRTGSAAGGRARRASRAGADFEALRAAVFASAEVEPRPRPRGLGASAELAALSKAATRTRPGAGLRLRELLLPRADLRSGRARRGARCLRTAGAKGPGLAVILVAALRAALPRRAPVDARPMTTGPRLRRRIPPPPGAVRAPGASGPARGHPSPPRSPTASRRAASASRARGRQTTSSCASTPPSTSPGSRGRPRPSTSSSTPTPTRAATPRARRAWPPGGSIDLAARDRLGRARQRPRAPPAARPPRGGRARHGLLPLQQRRDRGARSPGLRRRRTDPDRRLGPPPRQRHAALVLGGPDASCTSRRTSSRSTRAPARSKRSAAAPGRGFTVNVAWGGGMGDAEYLAAFDRVLLPIARALRPGLRPRLGGLRRGRRRSARRHARDPGRVRRV